MRRRLQRLVRREAGYSVVELLTVMVVLGTILGALTTVFVQGSNAQVEANRHFQAQLEATASLDRLRRDVHCASSASVTGTTMTLTGCGTGEVSWCAVGSGTRYALYRQAGATCDSTGRFYADYLISSAIFTYTAPVAATSLAKVHVDLQVNVLPAKAIDTFQLVDDLVLRNSLRA